MKSIVREKMLAKRAQIPENEAKALSEIISKKLFDNFNMYSSYGLYYGVNKEVELSAFLTDMRRLEVQQGKRDFYLPKVIGNEMYFGEYSDDLVVGFKGILEPRESVECKLSEDSHFTLDVIVVPGLAFDRLGFRIGYGKGFYDKWFSRYASRISNIASSIAMSATGCGLTTKEGDSKGGSGKIIDVNSCDLSEMASAYDLSSCLYKGDLRQRDMKEILKIGVCYDWQIVDNIYPSAHDVKMNYIVSESLIIKC